jgi:putative glutamine amidotransferase
MPKPLIGLTGRRKVGRDLAGTPEPLHGLAVDAYFADYARGVLEAGGLPVHLPIDLDPDDIVDRLDGLLLPGGTDIDPTRYGATPHAELLAVEPERDSFELGLLARATIRDIPVLGICRGLQLINVLGGGTLHQHVAPHARFDLPPDTEKHTVELKDGSTLHRLYGPTREVNTLHHQTIDVLGRHLTVTAIADDGEVEGIEHDTADIVAVQWHPELMAGRADDPVFRWLVDTAATRMAS